MCVLEVGAGVFRELHGISTLTSKLKRSAYPMFSSHGLLHPPVPGESVIRNNAIVVLIESQISRFDHDFRSRFHISVHMSTFY